MLTVKEVPVDHDTHIGGRLDYLGEYYKNQDEEKSGATGANEKFREVNLSAVA